MVVLKVLILLSDIADAGKETERRVLEESKSRWVVVICDLAVGCGCLKSTTWDNPKTKSSTLADLYAAKNTASSSQGTVRSSTSSVGWCLRIVVRNLKVSTIVR